MNFLDQVHAEAWRDLVARVEEMARINIAVGQQVYEVPPLEHLEAGLWRAHIAEPGIREIQMHVREEVGVSFDPPFAIPESVDVTVRTIRPVAWSQVRVTFPDHASEWWHGVGLVPEQRLYVHFHGTAS